MIAEYLAIRIRWLPVVLSRNSPALASLESVSSSRSPVVRLGEVIARTHHEHWDGSGYPAGLAGTDIPLAGRITAVCDVFDALVSERPYKAAWAVEDALEEIRALSGSQFDPRLVELFLELVAVESPPEMVQRAHL